MDFPQKPNQISKHQSIMGDLTIKGNGIHKWDILVENLNSNTVYIGICEDEKFNKPGDKGFHEWTLSSDGYVYFGKNWKWNNAKFKENDVVNIVVNMEIKHCYFSVNGVIHYEAYGH